MTDDLVLYNCNIYSNLNEYLKFNNMEEDEFKDMVADGWCLDCTCGTFNGATDEFTPWDITPKNVSNSLVETFHENSDIDTLMEVNEWNDSSKVTRDDILEFMVDYYDVTIFEDSKQIYLDMN